jgi:hypothetical protein
MTPFEEVQAKVALLTMRVSRLEEMHEPNHLRRYDVSQALSVMNELGLDRAALAPQARGRMGNFTDKKRLAIELRKRGWGCERIGRAINCGARSVKRWSKGLSEQ